MYWVVLREREKNNPVIYTTISHAKNKAFNFRGCKGSFLRDGG